jgi:hypothetical protein
MTPQQALAEIKLMETEIEYLLQEVQVSPYRGAVKKEISINRQRISELQEFLDPIPYQQLWRYNPSFYDLWVTERERGDTHEPFYYWFDQFSSQPNAVLYRHQIAAAK